MVHFIFLTVYSTSHSLIQQKFFTGFSLFVDFLKVREWGRRRADFFGGCFPSLPSFTNSFILFVSVPQPQVHCNSTTQIWSIECFKFFHLEQSEFGWVLLGLETQISILRCPFWQNLLLLENQISAGRAPGRSCSSSCKSKIPVCCQTISFREITLFYY